MFEYKPFDYNLAKRRENDPRIRVFAGTLVRYIRRIPPSIEDISATYGLDGEEGVVVDEEGWRYVIVGVRRSISPSSEYVWACVPVEDWGPVYDAVLSIAPMFRNETFDWKGRAFWEVCFLDETEHPIIAWNEEDFWNDEDRYDD